MAKWRWYIDLMGFSKKGITNQLYEKSNLMFSLLKNGQDKSSDVLMVKYLKKLGDMTGMNQTINNNNERIFSEQEILFLNLLSAFFHTQPISMNINQAIIEGYLAYKEQYPNEAPEEAYYQFLTQLSVDSPTYLPAVENTASQSFEDMSKAIHYTVKVLNTVYQYMCMCSGQSDYIISARNAAWKANWNKANVTEFFQTNPDFVTHTIENNEVVTNTPQATF